MEHSPFGRLPPELRNNIYELVPVQTTPLDLEPNVDPVAVARTSVVASFDKWPLAFVRTCKQIEAESSKVIYSGNTFRLTNWASSPDYTRLLVPFISQIGKLNAAAVRTVQVKIGHVGVQGFGDFLSRMTTAVANIQHRQQSLPACTFTLHFYVYGDKIERVLDLVLCLKDKDAMETSRRACMERVEVLAKRMAESDDRRMRRRAHSMVKDHRDLLEEVCESFDKPA